MSRLWSKRGMRFFHASERSVVRDMATSRPALSLPAHIRRAAAADPGLEWDAASYRYRRKARTTPPPSLATGDHAEPEGGQKLSDGLDPRPVAARNKNANSDFSERDNG